jgi:PIN domain nuclease of toxin-antitoxin system
MGSIEVILLDTHVALWAVFDDNALGRNAKRLVLRASDDNELAISAVSFWEIALLIRKRRLRLVDSAREARRVILAVGTTELPVTGEIAILAGEFENLHDDPAGRFIAASAIVHDATLLTADERLLKSRHIPRKQNAEA